MTTVGHRARIRRMNSSVGMPQPPVEMTKKLTVRSLGDGYSGRSKRRVTVMGACRLMRTAPGYLPGFFQ